MSAAIETAGLSKHYGPTRAVDELELLVDAGQVFGFLGPNGAGKTTTIRMLLALQRPSAGSATVLGLDAQRDSVAIHARIGYLPGELELYPRLNGRRHIEWFARARGLHDTSFADELVRRFEVVVDRPLRELSKGNKQKIGLVLACMHRPELLILDEPTSGLDPLMQNEFEELVRETVAEGRTVFLSSHELDEVQRVCDRVGIIRGGRLIAVERVADLLGRTQRRVSVQFAEVVDPGELRACHGVTGLEAQGPRVTFRVAGDLDPVVKAISRHTVVDLEFAHPTLEEVFLTYYEDGEN